MTKLRDVRLGVKFMVSFLLVGVLPFLIMGLVSLNQSKGALEKFAYGQLNAIKEIKKVQLKQYFNERESDMSVLLEIVSVLRQNAFDKLSVTRSLKISALNNYLEQFKRNLVQLSKDRTLKDAFVVHSEKSSAVSEDANQYQAYLKEMVQLMNATDMLLIDNKGNIIVSANGSLKNCNLQTKTSPLTETWHSVKSKQYAQSEGVAFADFSLDESSHNQRAYGLIRFEPDSSDRGKFKDPESMGCIAVQFSDKAINKIANNRQGMGNSGETYIVGQVGNRFLFRSNLMTMGDGLYKTGYDLTSIVPDYIKKALSGETNTGVYSDSKQNMTIVSYAPVHISGMKWAMISKINLEEAISPKMTGGNRDLFAEYIEKYGYYDFFLIHPKGNVFYTVTRENDYGTNMINGKYANSGLGILTQKVLQTKTFGFEDFKPYAASNNEPASFIAKPLLINGQVELIVALQLSLESINKIMKQREGMGKTGETYLVGEDRLMRSDSFLEPVNHTVKSSFANPSKGSVKTQATQEAFEGKEDAKIILDYNGNPVLSSFTPLNLWGVDWALIAEIDESEAFAAIRQITWIMIIIFVIGLLIIIGIALFMTQSIVNPVKSGVSFAEKMASGDLTQTLSVDQKDEIGVLAKSLNVMSDNLKHMFGEIALSIQTLSSSSTELSAISTQLSERSGETSSRSQTVAAAAEEMSANMNTVSASVEQTSASTQTVASASEEMSITIKEISGNMEKARVMANSAVGEAENASGRVNQLGESAQEINSITEVINEISEQTNLLALNATIEAARAGEAGKGFSVVANEIKNLAKQTAESTGLIKEKIESIQGATQSTVNEIENIQKVINDINDMINGIAAGLEEQSVATTDISMNIAQISQGVQETSSNVVQSATASSEIAENISHVSHAANEISQGSSHVKDSTDELNKIASMLEEMIGKFKIN
jgi:methyl-accepting chemotaxis protein